MAEDIISTLPDSILCEIISFLPTNVAIKTSVVSKRWKNIHRSVPTLDFTNLKQCSAVRLNNIVFSVLLSRDANAPIRSFLLRIPQNFYLGSVNKWASFVIEHRVEHLSLKMEMVEKDTSAMPKLPLNILTTRTLVVLELKGFHLEGFSSVKLPSLKTLRFRDIWFSNVGDLVLLLGGCPMLEDLQLVDIDFKSWSCLTHRGSPFRLPSLKTLHFERMWFSKVGDLATLLAGCPILDYLDLIGIKFKPKEESALTHREWKRLSFDKLSEATIKGCDFHFPLKALQSVNYLLIEVDKVYHRNDVIPTFHNLTCLDLYSLNYNLGLLVDLLQHCPKLQHLHIDEADLLDDGTWTVEDDGNKWVEPEFVPPCLSLHLRGCEFHNFLGLPGDIMLAKYILMNARVLQTIHFVVKGTTKIEGLLSSCPRASEKCNVIFHNMP